MLLAIKTEKSKLSNLMRFWLYDDNKLFTFMISKALHLEPFIYLLVIW